MVKPCFRSEIQTQGHLDQLSIADLDVHALGHRISEKSRHLCYALASSLPFNFATTCASLVVHERPGLSSLSSLQRTGFQGLSLSIGGNDCWNWKHRAGLSHGEQRVGPERASCFLVVFGIFWEYPEMSLSSSPPIPHDSFPLRSMLGNPRRQLRDSASLLVLGRKVQYNTI
ncbi:predicted protein [Histoplasma capsulatum G186AR]|uniref:Uncharacterized protein n=1 Tax=Ajellomyces capsulatus (strain G186AR / H82 / ATCC MYA-2454 / RMSCC 2432) TaxID=447093 RepID=C0NW62_AJECG|nr:uncharacterized protein HCBG_07392 [Histoplasma capsulatum G186AR]EEH04167.1 predicted protein [Histoplasma capsulatum G186AR]